MHQMQVWRAVGGALFPGRSFFSSKICMRFATAVDDVFAWTELLKSNQTRYVYVEEISCGQIKTPNASVHLIIPALEQLQ